MKDMKNKLQNFWYYYKVPALIILAILAAGLYFFLTNQGSVTGDYDIAVISARSCTDEQLTLIRTAFGQAGKDQNGDGIVEVKTHVYRFALGEDGQDPKEVAGLDADLVGKMSGIFFTEYPDRFESVTNGIGKAADAIPVSDIPALSGCGIDYLYLLSRADADPKYTALISALTE